MDRVVPRRQLRRQRQLGHDPRQLLGADGLLHDGRAPPLGLRVAPLPPKIRGPARGFAAVEQLVTRLQPKHASRQTFPVSPEQVEGLPRKGVASRGRHRDFPSVVRLEAPGLQPAAAAASDEQPGPVPGRLPPLRPPQARPGRLHVLPQLLNALEQRQELPLRALEPPLRRVASVAHRRNAEPTPSVASVDVVLLVALRRGGSPEVVGQEEATAPAQLDFDAAATARHGHPQPRSRRGLSRRPELLLLELFHSGRPPVDDVLRSEDGAHLRLCHLQRPRGRLHGDVAAPAGADGLAPAHHLAPFRPGPVHEDLLASVEARGVAKGGDGEGADSLTLQLHRGVLSPEASEPAPQLRSAVVRRDDHGVAHSQAVVGAVVRLRARAQELHLHSERGELSSEHGRGASHVAHGLPLRALGAGARGPPAGAAEGQRRPPLAALARVGQGRVRSRRGARRREHPGELPLPLAEDHALLRAPPLP